MLPAKFPLLNGNSAYIQPSLSKITINVMLTYIIHIKDQYLAE